MFATPSAFALSPAEKPGNYVASHWDTESGLPHNSVKQLFQTRDGYLWIGTSYGLARFDGLKFTVFNKNNTPAITNNQITSMAQTADGSLWIGTASGLVRHLDGKFSHFTKGTGLKSETVNTLCVVPDGSLWIGGREGVVRWVDGKFIEDINTSAFDTLGMRNITVARDKAVWLATGSQALRYKDGVFTGFGREQGLAAEPTLYISEDPEGRIIAVTQGAGIRRLEGNRFVPFELNAGLSSLSLTRTVVDHSGNLWIGSILGLDRYSAGKIDQHADRHGQKLGVVDVLLEDREGCLWVGSAAGLYRLTDRRAYSLSTEQGVSGNLINAVKETSDGSVWIASWGTGMTRIKNGSASFYTLGAPLSYSTVTSIHEGAGGAMWLGNRSSSIDRLEEGNKVTTYVYQSGVASGRFVTCMLDDDNGDLLLGIANRGLLHLREGKISVVPNLPEFSRATVWSLFRTRTGRLLMGTTLGIYERRGDRTWHPASLPGLEGTVIVKNFLEAADDELWLATEGHGLVRWMKDEARSYGSRHGVIDDILFSVLDDDYGSFWVSSARGIARIQKRELTELDQGKIAVVNAMTLGRADGLLSASAPGSGGPSSYRLSDGRLMFATDQGVAVIDPRTVRTNSQPPTVVIESVVADDERADMGPSIVLAAGTDKVEFRYTALSLIAPERLRFRYKLEGSDTRWVEAAHERSARYTHLTPGVYTFRVLACNNDGVWSENGATVTLTLLPYFYQTIWFRVAALLLLAGLIASIFGLRLRQLNQRQIALKRTNAELDLRVRERTVELSRSNEELQQRELLFRLIFEHAPVGISWKRADLGADFHFNSTFRRILDLPSETLPDYSLLAAMVHPEDAQRQSELNRRMGSGEIDRYTTEQRFVRKDEKLVWGLLAVAVIRDPNGRIIQEIGILEDITARKNAERELAETYKRLMEASRVAGMAEVATGVLHNVGNVLNSVNVSTTLLNAGLRRSRFGNVSKIATLLNEHAENLGTFLATDPRGLRIIPYLGELGDQLAAEQQGFLTEVESVQQNVEHIKQIVAMQQSHGRASGVMEDLSASELFEDALRMKAAPLTRHSIEIVREFATVPPVRADRHKVLQILINVIQNAKQAFDNCPTPDKRVTLRIESDDENVRLIVADNGVGIPPENLTKIFVHGFTTRADGHGFGLHSSANAAREMNGALTAKSAGLGHGATFILQLPIASAVVPAGA